MKDAYYFPHDYNAANDQKVLKLRVKFGNTEGYAIYFMILEAMAQEEDGILDVDCIAQLSLSYSLATEQLKAIIDYCIDVGLFIKDEKGIYTKRMLEHKKFRRERISAGKRGAKIRWGDSSAISQPLAEPMPKKEKEKEIKQNKNKIQTKLNLKTKGLARVMSKPSIDDVRAYCAERNNAVSPESFIAFYDSNGWKIGRNPMKDWKAAVRTWEMREKGNVLSKPKQYFITVNGKEKEVSKAEFDAHCKRNNLT